MKNKRWVLNYIDLFAGPGICRLRETGEEIAGSPLIAAGLKPPFSRLCLCDIDAEYADALQTRLAHLLLQNRWEVHRGDANAVVEPVLQSLPKRDTLNVVFLDPTGLHFEFASLRKFADHRCDLIVYFPDFVDVNRNLILYTRQQDSILDRALGPGSEWRDRLAAVPPALRIEELRNIYRAQIKKLGWQYSDFVRIPATEKRPLYVLWFFTKHEFALDLWRRTHAIGPGQQRSLPFD